MYEYEIKVIGNQTYIIIYRNNIILYTGSPSDTLSDPELIDEAILGANATLGYLSPSTDEGYIILDVNITEKTPPAPPKQPPLEPNVDDEEDTDEIISFSGRTTFNSPPTAALIAKKKELMENVEKLQKIGLPSTSDIGTQIWENMIKPKLLSQKQIAKKFLIMQGQFAPVPITEEDAQLIIYGKVFYKDGKLFDNDNEDPSCVSQPTDDDYEPPIDENNPLWQKITGMIEEVKTSISQLGIKLGEFLLAQPQAIAVMATSLVALVSSVIILPFGSGLPAALTAVQTMMATIQSLQAKTAEILPLLAIVDFIGLILPKEGQAIIAQINVILGIYLGVLAAITGILGILGSVMDKFKKSKKDMEEIPIKVELKAEPNPVVNKTKGTTLSVEATNGTWNYTYEWTDQNGDLISKDPSLTKDDGKRKVFPQSTGMIGTQYFCKVTDSNGATKEEVLSVMVF